MFVNNLRTAFEAIIANRLRSALTLLGIIIGVFSVTTIISLGDVATASITAELERVAAQQIFVTTDSEPGPPRPTTHADLSEADLEALAGLPVDIVRQQGSARRSHRRRHHHRPLPDGHHRQRGRHDRHGAGGATSVRPRQTRETESSSCQRRPPAPYTVTAILLGRHSTWRSPKVRRATPSWA